MFENLTPRRALPSLNALRAFEAMGRLGGATRAAAELNVTHSAVSRQVKALEAALGVQLFEGPRHNLQLTTKGRDLLAGLGAGFDSLDAAVRATRDQTAVHLAVHPSLAVKWLIPRLADFERVHPRIALHLSDLPVPAMRQRGADLSLRLMPAEAADDRTDILAANIMGPVCLPSVVADWRAAPRLVVSTHARGWSDWTAATGQPAPSGPARTLTHLHFALDAALSGLGVAALPWIIVADAIREGRLAAPAGFVSDGGALALLRNRPEPTAAERAVVRWLRDQIPAPP